MCYTGYKVTVIIWQNIVMYVLYGHRYNLEKCKVMYVLYSHRDYLGKKVMYVLYSHRDYLRNIKSCMCYTVIVIIWKYKVMYVLYGHGHYFDKEVMYVLYSHNIEILRRYCLVRYSYC